MGREIVCGAKAEMVHFRRIFALMSRSPLLRNLSMNIMQTGSRTTYFVPPSIEAYAQFDTGEAGVSAVPEDALRTRSVHAQFQNRKLVPSFFSSHLRMLVSLGFLLMIGLSFLSTSGLAGGTFQHLLQSVSLFIQPQPVQSQNISLTTHSSFPADASRQLVRISQLDPDQYASRSEYSTWAYSACSTASLTEVFDSFGFHFRITDVLRTESRIGAITPDLGLVDPSGIEKTAAQFGFKTQWGKTGSLDQIIAIANAGKPVIVGFPPDRYEGGHLLVVVGGNNDSVFLADTSLWNRRELSRSQFSQWWGGFYAVVTPQ